MGITVLLSMCCRSRRKNSINVLDSDVVATACRHKVPVMLELLEDVVPSVNSTPGTPSLRWSFPSLSLTCAPDSAK